MSTAAPQTILCELTVSRLAHVRTGFNGEGAPIWTKDKARRKGLDKTPPGFEPMTGSYRDVMATATQLNHEQQLSGRWDYLYHPEPVAQDSEEEA